MALIWDAFLEEYDYKIFLQWSPRKTLEAFWHYTQDGKVATDKWIKKEEKKDGRRD